MDKDSRTDLFPWILGGLLVAVGVPAVLAFTKPASQPVPVMAVVTTPAQPSPSVAAPPAAPVITPAPVPVSTQQATRPTLPAGQVWQCLVNGQKVFSDTACGDGATIRQLSDVNVMQPTPVAHARLYPGYGPYPGYGANAGYGFNAGPGYASPPAQPAAPPDQDGSSDDVYAANQVAVIDGRRRHEHFAPRHLHTHAAARGHF